MKNSILKATTFLFLFGIIFPHTMVLAQNGWKPNLYTGVRAENKKSIFSEHFQVDDKNLEGKSEGLTAILSTETNTMMLRAFSESGAKKIIPINFNTEKHFEIEAAMRWYKVGGKIGVCLISKDNAAVYAFVISPDKTFSIIANESGRETFIAYNAPADMIFANTENDNILTMRQVAGKWYFFINGEKVSECNAKPIKSGAAGYFLSHKAALVTSRFDVWGLNPLDNKSPLVTFLEPDARDLVSMSETRSYSGNKLLYITTKREVRISTKIADTYGVKEVRINGDIIQMQSSLVTYTAYISTDTTQLLIEAIDYNDNITQTSLVIVYQKPEEHYYATEVQTSKPITDPANAGVNERGGKNYVLFIGINQYEYWPDLSNPTVDCQLVAKTLGENYQFDPANFIYIFNEKATRKNMLKKIDSLARKLSKEDNLMVYYAGHGYYDEASEIGYWIPSDAEKGDFSGYIPNSTIKDMIRFAPSFHTLVVADACFSGSLLVRSGIEPLENKKSRWVITSGDFENVEDGAPGKGSPFAKALNEGLIESKDRDIRADVLYQNVVNKMRNNSVQKPQGTAMRDVGDEGGVFVFRRKK